MLKRLFFLISLFALGCHTHCGGAELNSLTSNTKPAPLAETNASAVEESDPRLHPDGHNWGFRPAPDRNPQLPRVLLIGDSIVGAYQNTVSEGLKGKASVDCWQTGLNENSPELHELLKKVLAHGPYVVIHFNIGLHGWQKNRVPDDRYEPLMRNYVAIIQSNAPQARLIWASTTPVTVKDSPENLNPDINPTIVERNAIAARIMDENHILIDDLYGLMTDKLALAKGDQFHWLPDGVTAQGNSVTAIILKQLPLGSAEKSKTKSLKP